MKTVVGDISRGVKQLKNLQSVTLDDCCDELTRGMVGGICRRQHIERFKLACKGKFLIYVKLVYYCVCTVVTT